VTKASRRFASVGTITGVGCSVRKPRRVRQLGRWVKPPRGRP
jgi:hypothetical protein